MTIFDAHSDLIYDITHRRLAGETDIIRQYHLDRLRAGHIEGSIFVLWVDPPYTCDHVARTRQLMACAREEFAQCNEVRVVHSFDEMCQARADGVIYIFLGIEGMSAIGNDLTKIDTYYDFGCRHAILTWNEVNALGAGARTGRPDGLTALGKAAVRHIQEKGMLLDVSHLNEAGFWDVVDLATAPITASHSNAAALCPVPRNLTDDQLRAIRDLNGVVGLNAFNLFISPDKRRQTVDELARHADHMINLMGVDHVGFGFDFMEFFKPDTASHMSDDGDVTRGLTGWGDMDNLLEAFMRIGLSGAELEKIAHGNFHRLIKDTIG